MEALRGDRTIQAISAKHEIHPNQISGWKRQAQTGLRDCSPTARAGGRSSTMRPFTTCMDRRVDRGARFFSTRARALSRAERREMIEREHDRHVSRQCQLVGLSRSTWYYRAVGESAETLALMHRPTVPGGSTAAGR